MNPDDVCALLEAARVGDERALRGALARLTPALTEAARATLRRNAALARSVGADEGDLVQHVLERVLRAPPSNAAGHPPVPVLLGWVRAVATNHLLDLKRRGRHLAAPRAHGDHATALGDDRALDAPAPHDPRDAHEPDDPRAAYGAPPPSPARVLEQRELWQRALACAEHQLARHKHLREVFSELAQDPELPALELARKVGLLAANDVDPERARKAVQHAWQLRSRVLARLRECLERDEPATSEAPSPLSPRSTAR